METAARDRQSQPLCCWQKAAAWVRDEESPAHTKLSNRCSVCIPDDDITRVRQVLPPSQRTRSPSCSVHLELHKTPQIAQAADLYQLTQEPGQWPNQFLPFLCSLALWLIIWHVALGKSHLQAMTQSIHWGALGWNLLLLLLPAPAPSTYAPNYFMQIRREEKDWCF